MKTMTLFELDSSGLGITAHAHLRLMNLLRTLMTVNESESTSKTKAFSSYNLSQVWTLDGHADQFKLPHGTKADLGYFPSFKCSRIPVSGNTINPLFMQADLLLTPLFLGNEAVKS
jgi:hypothetical protein